MASVDTYFDLVTDPLFRVLTAEQARAIAEYASDEALDRRIEQLAQKSTEGELTPEERAEYEAYARANRFAAVMKAKALRRLEQATER